MIKKSKKFLILGIGLVVVASWLLLSSDDPQRFVAFEVQLGESLKNVSRRLKEEKLIGSEDFFYYLARLTNRSADLKAGEYELHDQMNAWEILDVITGSQVRLYRVTIREGMNMFQIARLLRERGLVDEIQFLESCWDPVLARELFIPSFTVEGYLFPETYFIPKGASTKKIIRMFVDMFWNKMTPKLIEDAKRNNLSFHESVILASVIEKETGLAAEMGLIASVFYNRIQKKMKLQSDPTAVYDLLPYGGKVTRQHLFRRTAFNTYQIPALPLTPISNPGLRAIKAAVYPDKSEFLYFVSRGDGSHYFSKTYDEHKEAIEKFLR